MANLLACTLALLAAFAPCAVQAKAGYKEQYDEYMSCQGDGSADQTAFYSGDTQSSCILSMLSKGFRWYSFDVYAGQANCITTPTCDARTIYSVDAASGSLATSLTDGGVAPDENDDQVDYWRIKLQVCSTKDGTGVSTCDDALLDDDQKTGCALSGSYPCACGALMCTDGQVCTASSDTCAIPCDASSAPANGGVGTCTSVLVDECQPVCDAGYTVSGTSSCSSGVLTAATCSADPCDASTPPDNGGVGTCSNNLASGSPCQPTCNTGYTVSGTSSCNLGVLTAATCGESPCDASADPSNGAAGNCDDSLASGSSCQPTCNTGYTVSGTSSCNLGVLTAATCGESPCLASVVQVGPVGGDAGTCTGELQSGDQCQPTCDVGRTISCYSSCYLGVFTAATCDEPTVWRSDTKCTPNTYIPSADRTDCGDAAGDECTMLDCARYIKSHATDYAIVDGATINHTACNQNLFNMALSGGSCGCITDTTTDCEGDSANWGNGDVYQFPTAMACSSSRLYEMKPAPLAGSVSSVPLAGVGMVSVAIMAALMAFRSKRARTLVYLEDHGSGTLVYPEDHGYDSQEESADGGKESHDQLLAGAF